MTDFNFEEELKKLPEKPGVYLMHDENDTVIYVGKAKILKNRVRQYFRAGKKHSYKIELMVPKIAWFEYIVVDSEMEALVLECNLIKEHRPYYNTMLMDDKGYPYIRITTHEPFPRVTCVHNQKRDRARYFGPFPNATSMKNVVELLRKLYYVRTCNKALPKPAGPDNRPCLYYHMGQCKAPCQGYISQEDYKKQIDGVISFLNGNRDAIRRELKAGMTEAAENLDFEKAAYYRDLIHDVDSFAQKQKATDTNGNDRDIIGYAASQGKCVIQVFFVRGGKMIGREHFFLSGTEEENGPELLSNFIKQYYSGTPYIPSELIVPEEPEDMELLGEWLTGKNESAVHIIVPQKGNKEKLVELANNNARMVLTQDLEKLEHEAARTTGAVDELSQLLGLKGLKRMESYDISNISGFNSVGSMVVFEDGRPKRNDYRKFKIKTVVGPNDFESLREVLTRRFLHGLAEKENMALIGEASDEENKGLTGEASVENAVRGKFSEFPDIILMDGGKGQVSSAEQVLSELGIDIPVCGMVKDDNHRTRGLYFRGEELPIDIHGEGFKLLTRIQDETHRFAIEFHKTLRSKEQTHSILDEIPGIGTTRRRAIMKHFASLEELKNASEDEIAAVPSMDRKSARAILDFFAGRDKKNGSPEV